MKAAVEYQSVIISSMEQDMFPITIESWIYLSIACFIGFVIGQWIKTRRDKVQKKNESAYGLKKRILADMHVQSKKTKKKNRKANKRNVGS